jgi:hypothetical protein
VALLGHIASQVLYSLGLHRTAAHSGLILALTPFFVYAAAQARSHVTRWRPETNRTNPATVAQLRRQTT